jgi:hypothetical protein
MTTDPFAERIEAIVAAAQAQMLQVINDVLPTLITPEERDMIDAAVERELSSAVREIRELVAATDVAGQVETII